MFVGAVLFKNPFWFALSITGILVFLTALAFPSKPLLMVFGCWLVGVFTFLHWVGDQTDGILGLPAPAFAMLAGIWIIPILIWPLGFLLAFRRWFDQ